MIQIFWRLVSDGKLIFEMIFTKLLRKCPLSFQVSSGCICTLNLLYVKHYSHSIKLVINLIKLRNICLSIMLGLHQSGSVIFPNQLLCRSVQQSIVSWDLSEDAYYLLYRNLMMNIG